MSIDVRWYPPDHPRDRRGRFTESGSAEMTDAERDRLFDILSAFAPREFTSGADADAYLQEAFAAAGYGPDQQASLDRYADGAAPAVNASLRSSGGGDPDDYDTARELRGMMRPAPDDLILNRTVSEKAFGPALEDLGGIKVKDAAFSSTALGVSGPDAGNVQMKIAVPAGTPILVAGPGTSTPESREILLPDGAELGIVNVAPNGLGNGHDMSAVVLSPEPQTAPPAPWTPERMTEDFAARVDAPMNERQAVNRYTGPGYDPINRWLRGGDKFGPSDPDSPFAYTASDTAAITSLSGRYTTPADITVRRFMGRGPFPDGPMPAGTTFTDRGFASTTLGDGRPPGFDQSPVEMQIEVPAGSHGVVVNGVLGNNYDREQEFILPPGTTFEVTFDEEFPETDDEHAVRLIVVRAITPGGA